jgi:hypothetical protein
MSRSFRTEKESVTARRRGNTLPRVVERAPAPGDIHPLTARAIRGLFDGIPAEYLHGLTRIELRARCTAEVGQPFGCYQRREKVVVLYSVPPTIWEFPGLRADFRRSLAACYAIISKEEGCVRVAWPDQSLISLWYYSNVFTHELGHHYVEQYRHKNGEVGGRLFNEFVAEMHARRFTEQLFKRQRIATKKANKLINLRLVRPTAKT